MMCFKSDFGINTNETKKKAVVVGKQKKLVGERNESSTEQIVSGELFDREKFTL